MLSFSRFTSRVAQNALNFALVLLIVDETGHAIFSSLLVLALVLPSTAASLIAGPAADVLPKRLLVFLGNAIRALVCILFARDGGDVSSYYFVAVALAAAGPFATAAEGAMVPLIVRRADLARANAISQAVGGGAQLVGLGIVTPVLLRLFNSQEVLFIVAALLFIAAAVQGLLIGHVESPGRREIGGEPAGAWWAVGWRQMQSDRAVRQAAVELTLISAALIVLGGLIPNYIRDTLGLPIDIGVVVLLPAAAGVVFGLRVASFLAHRVPHTLLSTTGFVTFVVLLVLLAFVNPEAAFLGGYGAFEWLSEVSIGSFEGGGVLAMFLIFPLGFAFATVGVAGQTLINDRVPLQLQGRVLATQGAMAALAASLPVVLAGGLSDLVGVTPVMALLAGSIGIAAFLNSRPSDEPPAEPLKAPPRVR